MKGNEKVLEMLNMALADELSAINQYMVHSEMDADWGYDRLHELVEKRAIDEMRHAEKLIGRILFLEGKPIVSKLNPIHIGADVKAQLGNDVQSEYGAVKLYNEAVRLSVELADNGTRELFESLLKDEEEHVDWLETQLGLIEQIGLENYLLEQLH